MTPFAILPDGRKITALRQGSHVWTATLVDGNLTYTAPTCFNANLPRETVIAEIKRRSPEIEIAC